MAQSLQPPSASLWGGWYANILELSSFDTPEERDLFFRTNSLVQVLSRVEETTSMPELWSVVGEIDEKSVMQLNSPLLDALRNVRFAKSWTNPNLSTIVSVSKSIDAVSFCLKRGAGRNADFDDALRGAACIGNKDICILMFELGATCVTAASALCYAAGQGHKDIVQLLLDRGMDVHDCDDLALHVAACSGHRGICALLLDHGASLTTGRDAVLRVAAIQGHKDVVTLLLDRGAEIDGGGGDDTPLWYAAKYAHKDVCIELLDRGADIHRHAESALQVAVRQGHTAICELLLDRGARIDALSLTTMDIAQRKGHKDVIALLLERGARPV